jgi:hypothetical protein
MNIALLEQLAIIETEISPFYFSHKNKQSFFSRNNSRYQGNSRNYNQNRIQTNNETSGQSNNTYSQRSNQNGGNRYANQQTQGNNQVS